MFTKRSASEEKIRKTATVSKEPVKAEQVEDNEKTVPAGVTQSKAPGGNVNKILKGSKLIGDINVTCDLELSGDVEGNITSLQKSNILIKGLCKGNIETREGSVDIEGELLGGNITAGRDVNISGSFKGGEVKAAGKIFVDGEFNGKLEGNDVEIGPNSSGKGEIFYKEFISISRGAKVEVQISQARESLKEVKTPAKKETEETRPVQQSLEGN